MKKISSYLFILSGIVFTTLQATAQTRELGIEAGAANYFGDLNPNGSMIHPEPAVSIFHRKNFNHYFAWKNALSVGQAGYWDKLSSNPYRNYRNLNVRTSFGEVASTIEFNFFKYAVEQKSQNRFAPFVFIGIAVGGFYDQGKYGNQWIFLQAHRSEHINYPLFMVSVPFGGGIKYNLSKGVTFEIECMYHHLYTDYFDDVSGNYIGKDVIYNGTNLTDNSNPADPLGNVKNKQRGDQFKDAFMFTFISLSYTVIESHCPMPSTDPMDVF